MASTARMTAIPFGKLGARLARRPGSRSVTAVFRAQTGFPAPAGVLASGKLSAFVDKHPTIKMLALSFLVLIGVSLVAESLDFHIPKGYIYFAMAFSLFVEVLNIKLRRSRQAPVHLHSAYHAHSDAASSGEH